MAAACCCGSLVTLMTQNPYWRRQFVAISAAIVRSNCHYFCRILLIFLVTATFFVFYCSSFAGFVLLQLFLCSVRTIN